MTKNRIAEILNNRLKNHKEFLADGRWANPNDPAYSNGYDAAIEAEIEFLEELIKDIDKS